MIPAVPNPNTLRKSAIDWWKFLAPILITIVIIAIIYVLYKKAKAAGNAAGEEIGIAATAVKTGISPDRVSWIASTGQRLWDEGVSNPGFLSPWYNYDENMFIDALNAMQSVSELTLLDQYYRRASGESLKKAVTKSFSESDRAKVKVRTMGALLQLV